MRLPSRTLPKVKATRGKKPKAYRIKPARNYTPYCDIEDDIIRAGIATEVGKSWCELKILLKDAGFDRRKDSIRSRWENVLDPNLKIGPFTMQVTSILHLNITKAYNKYN